MITHVDVRACRDEGSQCDPCSAYSIKPAVCDVVVSSHWDTSYDSLSCALQRLPVCEACLNAIREGMAETDSFSDLRPSKVL